MKKTTFKGLFFMAFLSFTFFGVAQTSEQQKINSNTNPTDFYGVELNEENQSYYNQNGVVRCISDELDAKYRSENPNAASKQQFEDWIGPLVEERKQLIASQKAAGTYIAPPPYQIPIIFHIVSGSAGDAADLDAQYVNAQIDQLNIDFAAQDPDIPGSIWAGVAADAQIVFVPAQVDPNGVPLAEPGINRVYGYPGALGQADFDNTIKPATAWDRTMYCNNWTGNLGGGLLGYAQFPDNSTLPGMPASGGAANTDGVVNLYSSIGSELLPNPAGGVFGAGRTLTHEIGHWIGLRHIWGDGNCSVDDFCADTPNQGGSSSGCPNTADTCTTDGNRDMVENFMDYSHDTCMYLFTADQVARMQIVMENSPGRVELPNSTTGSAGPTISLSSAVSTQNEGSDCSFTDVNIDLVIGAGPSQNANVSIAATNVTATQGVDFDLMTTAVTFSMGATAPQSLTLRIYNDSAFEGNETFTLDLSVNPNGGDATIGNGTLSFTIIDDDVNPAAGGAPISIFSDDFESGLGNWTVTGNGTSNFVVGNNGTYPDAGFFNSDQSNTTSYVYVNDDSCNCDMSQERIALSTGLDLTSYSNVSATFSYVHDNQYVTAEYASLEASIDNGATWTEVSRLAPETASDNSALMFQTANIDVSAYAGQNNVLFSLFYNDGAGWAQGLIFDNFSITTPDAVSVQTAMNVGTTEDQMQIIGASTSNAFDTSSNNVILTVDSTDASNYGCVSASVSREGTSGQSYNGSIAPALVMDKTYTVLPGTANNAGASTISFYVTEAELAGWEAVTSDSRNNLKIAQVDGGDVTTTNATITPFGSNFKVTGSFTTGIRGTYYFGNIALLNTEDFSFNDFVLYPNPVKDQLNVSFTTSQDVAISLYDIRGREVQTSKFKVNGSKFNTTLNLGEFSSGIYVMKINSGDNTMFKKLVIN